MVAEIPPPWFVAIPAVGVGLFGLWIAAVGLALCLVSRTPLRGPLDDPSEPRLALAFRRLTRLALPAAALVAVGGVAWAAGAFWNGR